MRRGLKICAADRAAARNGNPASLPWGKAQQVVSLRGLTRVPNAARQGTKNNNPCPLSLLAAFTNYY